MNIHDDIKEQQQRDQSLYFVEEGEKDFNPAHNTWVINKTIKQYEAKRKRQKKEYEEKREE